MKLQEQFFDQLEAILNQKYKEYIEESKNPQVDKLVKELYKDITDNYKYGSNNLERKLSKKRLEKLEKLIN